MAEEKVEKKAGGDGEKPAKAPKAEKADKPEKGGGEKGEKSEKKAKGEGGGGGGGKKGKKDGKEAVADKPRQPARLGVRYKQEIAPALQKTLGLSNLNEVPTIKKIVVSMGLGEAITNNKILELASDELTAITGQKPVITKAKKSIANFKLREGMPIGAMVTLRRARMWEFLDRVISIALPRVRDFKGVSDKAFDGRGNYTLGLKEQIIFPEVDYDKVDKIRGMNIVIVTSAKNDVHGKALLEAIGVPMWKRVRADQTAQTEQVQ